MGDIPVYSSLKEVYGEGDLVACMSHVSVLALQPLIAPDIIASCTEETTDLYMQELRRRNRATLL